jgi:hypothetical protein
VIRLSWHIVNLLMVNHISFEEEGFFLLYNVLLILETSNYKISYSSILVPKMSVGHELPHTHWHGGCNSSPCDFGLPFGVCWTIKDLFYKECWAAISSDVNMVIWVVSPVRTTHISQFLKRHDSSCCSCNTKKSKTFKFGPLLELFRLSILLLQLQ